MTPAQAKPYTMKTLRWFAKRLEAQGPFYFTRKSRQKKVARNSFK